MVKDSSKIDLPPPNESAQRINDGEKKKDDLDEVLLLEKESTTKGLIENMKSTFKSVKSKFYTVSGSVMQVLINYQGDYLLFFTFNFK